MRQNETALPFCAAFLIWQRLAASLRYMWADTSSPYGLVRGGVGPPLSNVEYTIFWLEALQLRDFCFCEIAPFADGDVFERQ